MKFERNKRDDVIIWRLAHFGHSKEAFGNLMCHSKQCQANEQPNAPRIISARINMKPVRIFIFMCDDDCRRFSICVNFFVVVIVHFFSTLPLLPYLLEFYLFFVACINRMEQVPAHSILLSLLLCIMFSECKIFSRRNNEINMKCYNFQQAVKSGTQSTSQPYLSAESFLQFTYTV